MNHKAQSRRPIKPIILVAALLAVLVGSGTVFTPSALAEDQAIANVKTDRNVIEPGEQAAISFNTAKPGRITVQVHSPDYVVVRDLVSNVQKPAGHFTFFWDGTDDQGRRVPDEAYTFGILLEAEEGETATYAPAAVSGGEKAFADLRHIEKGAGGYEIGYFLPEFCRVALRAGVHEGPLLATLVDWRPRTPGMHTLTWSGKDPEGNFDVLEIPDAYVYIEAFRLPENSVWVKGSDLDYRTYLATLPDSESRKEITTARSVQEGAMERSEAFILPQYTVPQSWNTTPQFAVFAADDPSTGLAGQGSVTASGDMALIVAAAPDYEPLFNQMRFELVVYVDGRRIDEEESAYTPYHYVLDTRRLTEGEHLITFNLASITGQVGAYSFNLSVDNH